MEPGLGPRLPSAQELQELISHIQHEQRTGSDTGKEYCRYLPLVVNHVACSALVDSGNVWRTAISDKFAKRLGLHQDDLRVLSQTKVRTAHEDGSMEVLGETKRPLRLLVQSSGTPLPTITCKPVVIKGLGMHMNISGPFLQKHRIDQLHSANALRFPGGHQVPLLPRADAAVTPEAAQFAVIWPDDVKVPANCIVHTDAHVQGGEDDEKPNMEGMVAGNPELLERKGLVPWSRALVKTNDQGKLRVGLCNPTTEAILIRRGTKYGEFKKICSLEEETKFPWRVSVILPEEDPVKKEEERVIKALKGKLQELEEAETRLLATMTADRAPNKPTVRDKMKTIIDTMVKKKEAAHGKEEPVATATKSLHTKAEKETWVREAFRIPENPILRTPQEQQALVDLLLSYWDAISTDGSFGHTDLVVHEIHTGNAAPIKCKSRPINPALLPDLEKQLQTNLDKEVVEPSSSPWSFPLVAAPKKSGSVRWCVDYRRLNQVTEKDAFPLPNIEDNLVNLEGAKIFSTLDGSGAFHVVDVKERDRPKTAFSTPFGLFQYKRMPFGLTNGPATYSRLVQIALRGVPPSVAIPYLDDIIVLSSSIKQHFEHLEQVLKIHREAGLKLQPAKCYLFQPQVEYLGHLVDQHGLQPLPDYLQIVKNWQLPKTRTEVRIFLGKVGYYRRFIKGYSAIAAPLTDWAGKGTPEEEKQEIPANEEFIKAFETLKEKLLTAPILAYPRFNSPEPFILDTDWCQDGNAIGGVLSQVQDGVEKVIMYGGKKLSAAQKNYAATKGELSALLYFVKNWSYYLRHRRFLLRTDHAPLAHLKTMEPQDRHTLRMLGILADYDFEVKYRPGPKHGNADALSRAPHLHQENDAKEDVAVDNEEERYLLAMEQLNKTKKPDHNFLLEPVYQEEELRILQADDDVLEPVRNFIMKRKFPDPLEERSYSPEIRTYLQMAKNLWIDGQGLLCLDRFLGGVWRTLICLPEEAQDACIRHAHKLAGHAGVDKTLDLLTQKFFFLHMRKEVMEVLQGCKECQRKRRDRKDQRHTLVSVVDGYPFQRISIDFVGPLPKVGSALYIFTVRDTFTKWLEAFAVPAATSKHALQKLTNDVIRRYGIPEEIHSDQGTHFTSRVFTEVAKELGIRHTTTPAYNPKSNPVERVHRDLGNMLRAMAVDTKQTWPELLPAAVMAINTTRHAGTKYSPFRLLFGRDPQLPLSVTHECPGPAVSSIMDFAKDKADAVKKAYAFVRENLRGAVETQRRQYHAHHKSFEVGTQAWLFSPIIKPGPKKFLSYWTGPWTVLRQVSAILYEIEAPPRWSLKKSRMVVSIDRLKPYQLQDRERPPDEGEHDLESASDPFAERPPAPPSPPMSPPPTRRAAFRSSTSSSSSDSSDDDEQPAAAITMTPAAPAAAPVAAPAAPAVAPGGAPGPAAAAPVPVAAAAPPAPPEDEPAAELPEHDPRAEMELEHQLDEGEGDQVDAEEPAPELREERTEEQPAGMTDEGLRMDKMTPRHRTPAKGADQTRTTPPRRSRSRSASSSRPRTRRRLRFPPGRWDFSSPETSPLRTAPSPPSDPLDWSWHAGTPEATLYHSPEPPQERAEVEYPRVRTRAGSRQIDAPRTTQTHQVPDPVPQDETRQELGRRQGAVPRRSRSATASRVPKPRETRTSTLRRSERAKKSTRKADFYY